MNQKKSLKKLFTYSPRFQALLNKSRQSIKAGKGLSRDEFWQTVRERSDEQENEQPVPEDKAD